MSDEKNQKTHQSTEWRMPEPVFRTSEGRPPGKPSFEDSQADIPTEPGFTDRDDEDETNPTASPAPSPRAPVQQEKPSREGCASGALAVVAAVSILTVVVIGLLVYYLFFYQRAETLF